MKNESLIQNDNIYNIIDLIYLLLVKDYSESEGIG